MQKMGSFSGEKSRRGCEFSFSVGGRDLYLPLASVAISGEQLFRGGFSSLSKATVFTGPETSLPWDGVTPSALGRSCALPSCVSLGAVSSEHPLRVSESFFAVEDLWSWSLAEKRWGGWVLTGRSSMLEGTRFNMMPPKIRRVPGGRQKMLFAWRGKGGAVGNDLSRTGCSLYWTWRELCWKEEVSYGSFYCWFSSWTSL